MAGNYRFKGDTNAIAITNFRSLCRFYSMISKSSKSSRISDISKTSKISKISKLSKISHNVRLNADIHIPHAIPNFPPLGLEPRSPG